MSANAPAPLAVALGDPAGIGPELIAEAFARRGEAALPPFFAVGGATVLQAAAMTRGLKIEVAQVASCEEVAEVFSNALPVLGSAGGEYRPGAPDEAGAALALHSLAEATRCALLEQASAVVTAPVAKAQLAQVGFEFPGQTEFLAAACGFGPDDVAMMLAGPSLRTVPITIHCALADVPALLSSELIVRKARIVAQALQHEFGIAHPRLAIAALNPHAGEGGKFGLEERNIIAPAIETLRAEGIDATGPHPGDALFTPRARAGYDAALCMYHDQALIPLKALEFDHGVNVTLGLPIIRTSPDHGTAFDIAGQGVADPGAMCSAIRLAGELAARRARHG
ncbi:MAG: 4-hydroxythreonine-4-phosphate dehydrogenase PdxA [Erythrobacter sp.]